MISSLVLAVPLSMFLGRATNLKWDSGSRYLSQSLSLSLSLPLSLTHSHSLYLYLFCMSVGFCWGSFCLPIAMSCNKRSIATNDDHHYLQRSLCMCVYVCIYCVFTTASKFSTTNCCLFFCCCAFVSSAVVVVSVVVVAWVMLAIAQFSFIGSCCVYLCVFVCPWAAAGQAGWWARWVGASVVVGVRWGKGEGGECPVVVVCHLTTFCVVRCEFVALSMRRTIVQFMYPYLYLCLCLYLCICIFVSIVGLRQATVSWLYIMLLLPTVSNSSIISVSLAC